MAMTETEVVGQIREEYKYGFSNPDEAGDYFFKSGRGISHEVVEAIAEHKNEPDWMRKVRHQALDYFFARPIDRKSTRLNSSHITISYAVFCLKKKKKRWADER